MNNSNKQKSESFDYLASSRTVNPKDMAERSRVTLHDWLEESAIFRRIASHRPVVAIRMT